MSLTACERVETHSLTSIRSSGSGVEAFANSYAALKMYFSYLGLLRILKVLLSY